MIFPREKAFGMRLDIAAGTAVRFEPGEATEVQLVEFGGTKTIYGFNNLTGGETTSAKAKATAVAKANQQQFKTSC